MGANDTPCVVKDTSECCRLKPGWESNENVITAKYNTKIRLHDPGERASTICV